MAAAGLRSRLESLQLVGNNLANVSTAGFKADREFYNLFLTLEAEENPAGELPWMPVVQGSAIDFRQGGVTPTGAPLDLALNGPGLFVIEGPQGRLYTRNGNFKLSRAGRLETADGYAVLGQGGPLQLPPGEVVVAEDGTVTAGQQQVGRIRVVELGASQTLSKVGHNYFQSLDATPPQEAARTSLRQGQLEASNVNAAEAAVRLVWVSRQFEMLSRAIAMVSGDMNRRAIEEIPRLGG